MKEDALINIRKIGKAGRIIMNISKFLVIVGLILSIVGTVVILWIPEDLVVFDYSVDSILTIDADAIGETVDEDIQDDFVGSVSISQYGIVLDDVFVEDNKLVFKASKPNAGSVSFKGILYIMVVCDVMLVITLISLFFAGSLCTALEKCESPFDTIVINKMRNFAFSLIPWVFTSSLSNSIASSLHQSKVDIGLSVDLKMVIVVLAILALTAIFKYGAVLQKESDETL